jgi:hypothetical protein
MRARGPAVTADVLERLRDAQNRYDLDAFLDCFDSGYRSEQPVHPDRAFTGQEQVRRNWTAVFDGMPDFRAELREACERDLAVDAAEGVHFEHVWLDPVSGKVFCLSSGPSKEAVLRVHDKAGQGTHRGDLRAGGRGRAYPSGERQRAARLDALPTQAQRRAQAGHQLVEGHDRRPAPG